MRFFKFFIFFIIFLYCEICLGINNFMIKRIVFNSFGFVSKNLLGLGHTFFINPIFLYSKEKIFKKNKNDIYYDNFLKISNILSKNFKFKLSSGIKQVRLKNFCKDLLNEIKGKQVFDCSKIKIVSFLLLGFLIRGVAIKFGTKKISNMIFKLNLIKNFNNKIVEKILHLKFLNKVNFLNDFVKKCFSEPKKHFLDFALRRGLDFSILQFLSYLTKKKGGGKDKKIDCLDNYYNSKIADCGFATFKITNLFFSII